MADRVSFRLRTFRALDAQTTNTRGTRLCNYLLLGLITLNVVAVFLESVPSVDARYHPMLAAFDAFSVAVFTVEYLLRVWSSVEAPDAARHGPIVARLRYMVTPLALIDLVVVLPFLLSVGGLVELGELRVLRLLRFLKFTRYSRSVALIAEVIREEGRHIMAALFILSLLLVVASALAYVAEHEVQPDRFGTILEAMWWAVITMTTVGYGDVVPVTPLGKLVAGAIGVIGIGMVALPAGLLASGFTHKLHYREQRYGALLDEVLADGQITERERETLERAREVLGLSEAEAAEIYKLRTREHHAAEGYCPHCGQPLPGHEEDEPTPPPAEHRGWFRRLFGR